MSQQGRQTATVRVTVVVEVNLSSAWGPDCTMQQVYGQGTSEAINHVRNRLQAATNCRVIGATTTDIVVHQESKRDASSAGSGGTRRKVSSSCENAQVALRPLRKPWMEW